MNGGPDSLLPNTGPLNLLYILQLLLLLLLLEENKSTLFTFNEFKSVRGKA